MVAGTPVSRAASDGLGLGLGLGLGTGVLAALVAVRLGALAAGTGEAGRVVTPLAGAVVWVAGLLAVVARVADGGGVGPIGMQAASQTVASTRNSRLILPLIHPSHCVSRSEWTYSR